MRRLTDVELIIMDIVWESKTPLTSSEIAERTKDKRKKLSQASVNQKIPKLLEEDYLGVEAFRATKTKYSRAFVPLLSREEYTSFELNNLLESTSKISSLKNVLLTFLESEGNQKESIELLDDLKTYVESIERSRKE